MPEALPSWHDNDVLSLKDFARIRLIVADLDGTLIRVTSSQLSRMIQSLNRKLSSPSQHVLFTVATGRAYAGISSLLTQLSLRPSVPVAVYNGSLVIVPSNQSVLLSDTIPSASLLELLKAGAQHRVPMFVYNRTIIPGLEDIFDPSSEQVFGWNCSSDQKEDLNGLPIRAGSDVIEMESLRPHAVLLDVRNHQNIFEELHHSLGTIRGISATTSSSTYLEIRPAGATKGSALTRIAEHLSVGRDEVLAIGDNDNDVEMLKWAGVSVTVGGGSSAAQNSSTFVCRYGVESGVIEVLRIVRQAKRYQRFLLEASALPTSGGS